jgi:antitoxin (DNA-binding transcriptional repressor) of toxin-antitoxin stability system
VRAVGIKQLKARLSEYLRLVKRGETILVTEREEVVAEIRPAHHQVPRGAGLEDALDRLADSGEITRSSETKQGWEWTPRGLGLAAGAAARLLEELREDK